MPFIKGTSGNPKGRNKGTQNRLTKEARNILKDVLSNELKNLPAILEKLKPEDRVTAIIKILPYVLPKGKPISITANEPVNWEEWIGLPSMLKD
jgi:hypothetical protein